MIVALATFGGAIFGAVIAALVVQRLQRARPIVIVDTLRIAADIVPLGPSALVNRTLMRQIDDSPYRLGEGSTPIGEIPQKDYVEFLLSVYRDIQSQIPKLGYLSEIVDKLSQYLGTGDFERLEQLWAQEQTTLWPIIEGVVIRSELPIASIEADIPDDGIAFRHVVQDDDGDFLVDLPGVRTLGFIWSTRRGAAKESSKMLAEKAATAFAYRLRGPLEIIVNAIRGQSTDLLAPLRRLLTEIQTELDRYQRITVAGSVGNTGQVPLSVLNRGSLVVGVKGYQYRDSENPDRASIVPEDQTLSLLIGDNDGYFGQPLSVPSGGMARFSAVARVVMGEQTRRAALMQAFSGGERSCYLCLEVVGGGRIGPFGVNSPSWLFRDSGKEAVFQIDSTATA